MEHESRREVESFAALLVLKEDPDETHMSAERLGVFVGRMGLINTTGKKPN